MNRFHTTSMREIQRDLGLEYRDAQVKMAETVRASIINKKVALIEGGTGNGKTFSYLFPVIEHLHHNPEKRVIISTATIALQDQIVEKDLPVVLEYFQKKYGSDFRVSMADVVKLIGKDNYMCEKHPYFLEGEIKGVECSEDERRVIETNLSKEVIDHLKELARLARETNRPVTRQDIAVKIPQKVWDILKCKGPHRCAKRCAYRDLKESASQARILITNHHYLLSWSYALAWRANSKEKLGNYILIADEAHRIPAIYSDMSGRSVNLKLLMGYLTHAAESIGMYSAKLLLPAEFDSGTKVIFQDVYRDLNWLRERVAVVNNAITMMTEKKPTIELFDAMQSDGDLRMALNELREFLESEKYEAFSRKLESCVNFFKKEQKRINAYLEKGKKKEDGVELTVGEYKLLLDKLGEIDEYSSAVSGAGKQVAALYDTLVRDKKYRYRDKKAGGKRVLWFEKGFNSISLVSAPVNYRVLARAIWNRFFANFDAAVFTSATLTTHGNDFTFFKKEMGMNSKENSREIVEFRVPSAFSYDRQSLLLIPTDLPLPSYDGDGYSRELSDGESVLSSGTKKYYEAVAQSICDASRYVDGNCLVLCSSIWQTEFFTHFLEKNLKDDNVVVLSQINTYSLQKLLNLMRSGCRPKKILVGMQSLWQGIDLQGESLRGLFIVKMPFVVPDHPLVKARSRVWPHIYNRSYFQDVSLPEALTLLKQGSGRLIRSGDVEREYGVIVFYDHRFSLPRQVQKRKKYLKSIIGAFPDNMPMRFVKSAEVADYTREFFARRHVCVNKQQQKFQGSKEQNDASCGLTVGIGR